MRAFVTLFLFLLLVFPVRAQESLKLVRDAEIENILYRWNAPMWQAAGLNPGAVKIVMVESPDINAFTAGGQVIFVSTGLLMKAERPDEIIGVMAHETGHIVGGHVLLQKAKARNASYESIVGFILGAGAGILSGNADVGAAVATAGRAGAANRFLAHSRREESSADQAGITYLQQAGLPTRGLATFLEKLEDQELLPPDQQRGYARTHPITRDRIAAVSNRIGNDIQTTSQDTQGLERLQAKLMAFTSPAQAQEKFSKDKSATGIMARAIIAYRQSRMREALTFTDAWLKIEPDNPYAHELKGQILKDSGRPAEAVPSYERAITLAPRAGLIRIDAAHAMIESGNPALLDKAISQLNTGLADEPRSGFAFRLLATAYGQKGMEPEAQICLAEQAVLQGNTGRAKELLALARPKLKGDSPMRRRATDLKLILDSAAEDE